MAGKKRLALGISQFIILGLIFWKGFDLYGEQKSYRLKMMDYFTRTEQWDRILVSCKEPTTKSTLFMLPKYGFGPERYSGG